MRRRVRGPGSQALGLIPLLLLALLACGEEGGEPDAPPPPEDATDGGGTLVIVGGALSPENEPIYQAMIGAREGEGPFCIFPTASAEPQRSLESAIQAFSRYLAPEHPEGISLTVEHPEEASSPRVVEAIGRCSGFFFVGGSQRRISQVFRPGGADSPALRALRERFAEGAVISGSSAGAAMMTDPMIGGGGSVEALQHGVRSGADGEGVLLQTGLGFLDGVQVDQHFITRGRWGRLVAALLAQADDSLAFGIDENTALVVEGTRSEVVGESGVVFLDARDAGREEGGHGGYGIRMYLLGTGDRVDLGTGEVMHHPLKEGLASTDGGTEPGAGANLFGRGMLDDLLSGFALAPDPRVTFGQDGLMVELRKGGGFQALCLPPIEGGEPTEGGEVGPLDGLFLGPFVLSVWRERPGSP